MTHRPRLAFPRHQRAYARVGGQAEHHIPRAGDLARVFACARCVNQRNLVAVAYVAAIRPVPERPTIDGQALDDGVGGHISPVPCPDRYRG